MVEKSEDENRIKKDRLLLLADYLDELPADRFDYSRYASAGFKPENTDSYACSSTACAIGWAASLPFFRRLGLMLTSEKKNVYTGCDVAQPVLTPEFTKLDITSPTYKRTREVAEVIFGLTEQEWYYLFIPKQQMDFGERYIEQLPTTASPRQVAKHIRDFCQFGLGEKELSEHEVAEREYYDEEDDDD